MFNYINDRENPSFRYDGFYRGEVIENDDPEQAGRIKIRVFGVFDEINEDNLPWAIMADPLMGGLGNNGSAIVPNIGSHAFLFFENGDHRLPVYFAGAPAVSNGEPDLPTESREQGQYPFNKVFKTKKGTVVEFDDTDDAVRFKLTHPSGTFSEIDNDGNETKEIVGDQTETIEGSETREVNEDQTETISGSVTIEVSNDNSITINGEYTIDVNGNITVQSGGNIDITAGGIVSVQGTTIQLN